MLCLRVGTERAEPLSERFLRVWRSAEYAPEMRQRGIQQMTSWRTVICIQSLAERYPGPSLWSRDTQIRPRRLLLRATFFLQILPWRKMT